MRGGQIPRHEHNQCRLEVLQNAPVISLELGCPFWRELKVVFGLANRDLAQVLVDDIADVLQIDGERDDLGRTLALALGKAAV